MYNIIHTKLFYQLLKHIILLSYNISKRNCRHAQNKLVPHFIELFTQNKNFNSFNFIHTKTFNSLEEA